MAQVAGGRSQHPAPDPTGGKRALVLAGGGITGLTYEIGALRALDDMLVGATVNDFDMYVGTSAGSMVATLLAAGITPTEMALGVEGSMPGLRPPMRRDIYRPNLSEVAERLGRLPGLIRAMVVEAARHPSKLASLDLLGMLSPLLPSGVFDNRSLVDFVHQTLENQGVRDDFRAIDRELYVCACALDSGERVVFGRRRHGHVPISRAVAASTAIPLMFKPVRIDGIDYVDGGIKGNTAIDVAVDRGASLVVVINPVVPIDARRMAPPRTVQREMGTRVSDLGFRGVANQVARGILHDGMLDHIRLVRGSRPDVDILLIEPRADDDKMFFHELMSYSARLMVMQHGYESVSNGLYETWGYLRRILPRHGIHITRRNVERKPLEVPVTSVETPNLLQRLMLQTVFDRRPRVQLVPDDEAAAAG